MFEISTHAAAWFLPFVLPIGLWVAWSDMSRMKIPNTAVMTLLAIFVVIGPFVLSREILVAQLLHIPVVLLGGFFLNLAGAIGAGDAKFSAVAAAFVAPGDIATGVFLLGLVTALAVACHRTARSIPAVRAATGTWQSWQGRDFPMGLALGSWLAIYLLLGSIPMP